MLDILAFGLENASVRSAMSSLSFRNGLNAVVPLLTGFN